MFEKVKENFWLLILQMGLTVIGLILFSAFTKHQNTASIEYVDKENVKQDEVCLDVKSNLQHQIDNKVSTDVYEIMYKNQLTMQEDIKQILREVSK